MSRFDIRYTEIDDMMWECKDEMDSLIKSCEKYEDYINGFSQLSSFRGEAAEAIKAYMLDVHRSIISSIKTAANEFNDRFLIYKTGYYEIDNSCCYALPEEVLNQAITLYNNKLGDVIYESQRLKNALSNISGIYAIEAPSTFSIENEHNELNDKLNKLIESIKDYESETKTQSLTNLEKLLGALKTSLSKCSAQTSESVTEYTAGSFFTEEHTIDLANNVYVCYTFHSQNERQLEAAWDNEAEIREELERQREIQGFWQIVGGAFLIVTGTLCIVCTLGAATPIVVTGMVAGGGTILFGASDMLEGGQNIYYGANGDLSSTAFNPLRDTVFMGNQEIYDNTKNVFAFTAGAMCPISKAYGELGKLSFRTVGTIVGQEIISDQAGNLANMAVTEIGEQWNWNPYFTQTLAMGTGIFASNKTSNTLVGLDQKFNISGNYPKSFSAGMSAEDAARYEQFWQEVEHGLDVDSRIKINNWKYTPSAELYLKYKDVYDNPKYFDQKTGYAIYPGMNGDINIDGFTNGIYINETLMPGTIIDRYGSNGTGKYFSPEGTSYGERALPPFMENEPYVKYEVLVPFDVKSGEIAPWFDQPGQGTQYLSPYSVDELLDLGFINEIK